MLLVGLTRLAYLEATQKQIAMLSKDEFLALAADKYQQINDLQLEASFFAYEQKFSDIMAELSRQTLEKAISEVPLERRKKKS